MHCDHWVVKQAGNCRYGHCEVILLHKRGRRFLLLSEFPYGTSHCRSPQGGCINVYHIII